MPNPSEPNLSTHELQHSIEELNLRIEKQNALLTEYVLSQTDFRRRIVGGLWTGLGTVLGATVMVSAVVLILKPLANVKWISPVVQGVIQDLEKKGKTDQNSQARQTNEEPQKKSIREMMNTPTENP